MLFTTIFTAVSFEFFFVFCFCLRDETSGRPNIGKPPRSCSSGRTIPHEAEFLVLVHTHSCLQRMFYYYYRDGKKKKFSKNVVLKEPPESFFFFCSNFFLHWIALLLIYTIIFGKLIFRYGKRAKI